MKLLQIIHSRGNVSPMLSLPLQEEKWSAVLPLSSAAQGSMLSCRSVRTDGAHQWLEKKRATRHHWGYDVWSHCTCVYVIAVRSLPQSFHSCQTHITLAGEHTNLLVGSMGTTFHSLLTNDLHREETHSGVLIVASIAFNMFAWLIAPFMNWLLMTDCAAVKLDFLCDK